MPRGEIKCGARARHCARRSKGRTRKSKWTLAKNEQSVSRVYRELRRDLDLDLATREASARGVDKRLKQRHRDRVA